MSRGFESHPIRKKNKIEKMTTGLLSLNQEQVLILALLLVMLGLFLYSPWRHDVVALFTLLIASILGLVPTDKIFTGFGHPAVMLVVIVLIISYILTRVGTLDFLITLADKVSSYRSLHTASLVISTAVLSMFVNNIAALTLMMPIALQSVKDTGRSPSTILMPLSFGSLLGGLATLIGTPPNIIIATYRAEITGTPFSMFDFMPVGGLVALVGVLFISFIGWRLVRDRKPSSGSLSLFKIESYLFEVEISKQSQITGKTIEEVEGMLKPYDVLLASLIHRRHSYPIPYRGYILEDKDVLVLEGNQENIDKFSSRFGLTLLEADRSKAVLTSKDAVMMETVVKQGSPIEGWKVGQIGFGRSYGINVLAVSREGQSHCGPLREWRIRAGDVLLITGREERIKSVFHSIGCLPLAKRWVTFGKRKRGLLGLVTLGIAVSATTFGLFPIQVCLLAALLVILFLQLIPLSELYDGVDWSVIILLGSMIPLATALDHLGVTTLIAKELVEGLQGLSPTVMIAGVLIFTMLLSDILNNAATAILMAPVAKEIAVTAGFNVDPFLMAVAIGASCTFLTPIGHQNNALILGPGGYKFSDYWPFGLPLDIVIVLTAVPMILWVWPIS